MFKSQKNVFWEALFVTILIFGLGVLVGVILENIRVDEINSLVQKSEIDLLDIKLQNEIYSKEYFNCEKAIEENIKFADKIYEEARLLDKYEKASRLTEDIRVQHRKYDILRATLLLNSIKIKEVCDGDYYEVVYFYKYNEPGFDIKAKQDAFSKLLLQFKEEKGGNVLLIPIAGDNDISSINLLLDLYNISIGGLPVILINREIKITELQTVEEIQKHLQNITVSNPVIRL